MAGNTFGKRFCVTTFGESHGSAIGCVIDGCPSNLPLCEADIQVELDRRKPGGSPFVSQRRESDCVKILSGVFEGKTLGTPIGLLIENQDPKLKDYADLKSSLRPGHGDYTYFKKYGVRDYRGGGRASARETAVRVASGAIAKKLLKTHGVEVRAYLAQMGEIVYDKAKFCWETVSQNPLFWPVDSQVPELEALVGSLRELGDSIGARVEVIASGVPVGLGEPVFDKLDADLAGALMSIPAVKGVEIGAGFSCVLQKGSEHRDEMTPKGFLSNHAGGVLAGISTGQDITASLAFKPTSSIRIPGKSIDENGQPVEVVTLGRHDPCVGIRAVPVVEAMMALVLADQVLRFLGAR